MSYQENQNSEAVLGSHAYGALQRSLGTGPGEVVLESTSENHPLVMAQRGQALSTVYKPIGPVATSMSHYEPQYNYTRYPSPVKSLDTKRDTNTKKVTVKDG
jgi:hypothetical protein